MTTTQPTNESGTMTSMTANIEVLRTARKKNRSVMVELDGKYVVDAQVSCGIAHLGDKSEAVKVYNDPQYAWDILAAVERNNNAEDKARFVLTNPTAKRIARRP